MGRIEKSIEIKAPPEKVWEMLAIDRFQEWTVGLASRMLDTTNIEFTSEVSTPEDKYRVGTSAQSKGETFKVTESLKNKKITYLIGETGTNAGTITIVLESVEDGTKLTYVTEYEMPWGAFGKFLEKAFSKRIGERDLLKSLEKLKSILEK